MCIRDRYNATSYIFELKKTDWTTGVLVESKEVTTNTITVNALENTKYYWGVKAKNSSSESQFYKQILTIDTIPPSSPQLLTPANSQSITGLSVTFSWKDAANAGANARDSLLAVSYTHLDVYKRQVLKWIFGSRTRSKTEIKLNLFIRPTIIY